jgi:hypothetical protein
MIAGPNAKIQRSESKQLRRVVLREDPSVELQNCIVSVRCYTSSVLRKTLILALILGLVGLGTVPLSVCSLLSSKLAECATPKTQTHCDQMEMQENGTRLVAAPDTSCCFASNAPAPEYKASSLSLMAPLALASDPMGGTLQAERSLPVHRVQDLSPHRLQSLLCTFLV